MSRTARAPFDAYLRDPDPPPPPSLPLSADDPHTGAASASAMAHPFYANNSGTKSSFHPYADAYSQHPLHDGDDGRSRNSSSSSSGRSAVSSYSQADLPPLVVPQSFTSECSVRNAGGSVGGLQFQMPAFLGGAAVAPGGGGEVIHPAGLPMFPSFSVSGNGMSMTSLPTSQYSGQWAPNSAQMFGSADKTKRYPPDGEAPSPIPPSVALQARKPSMPFDYADVRSSSSVPGFAHHEERRAAGDASPMSPYLERPSTSRSLSYAQYLPDVSNADAPQGEHNELRIPEPSVAADIYSQELLNNPLQSGHFPLYSHSGCDVLPILARVCNRPRKIISLGPVDMSCAFVIADARQADTPIIYVSRAFCELTGYAENEVIGRNCRFLQAPDGRVARGEERKPTTTQAIREMSYAVGSDVGPRSWRECQVSLVNYRKDGKPFMNRVSIIPVPADDSPPVPQNSDNPTGWDTEIAYLVGFQVDINEQPSRLGDRIRDGRYLAQYVNNIENTGKTFSATERCAKRMCRSLREWICDSKVQSALSLTTSCNANPASKVSPNSDTSHANISVPANPLPDTHDARQWLHMLLLEHMPDFALVLSLKGHFLYVAPAIKRVLGYNSSELVGRCVSDFCHPSDSVPLLRELKESSSVQTGPYLGQGYGLGIYGATDATQGSAVPAPGLSTRRGSTVERGSNLDHELSTSRSRSVDLLFRMRDRDGNYKWIECLGRLHVEPGKGRKAIVLSGRVCPLPDLSWNAVSSAGGLMNPVDSLRPLSADVSATKKRKHSEGDTGGKEQEEGEGEDNEDVVQEEKEFWAIVCESGLVLVASAGVKDVLGWGAGEMIGRSIQDLFADTESNEPPVSDEYPHKAHDLLNAINSMSTSSNNDDRQARVLKCCLRSKDGETQRMDVVLYGPSAESVQNVTGTQRYILQCKTQLGQQITELTSASPMSRPIIPIPRRSAQDDPEVFAELAPGRATSWQYELQQLKFANRKLRREVAALEQNWNSPSSASTVASSSGSSLVLRLETPSIRTPTESVST